MTTPADDLVDRLQSELAAAHEDMRKCLDRWNKANGEANDAFMLLSDKHTLMTERAERAEADLAAARLAIYTKFAQHHGCLFQTGDPCEGCVGSGDAAIDAARKGTT